mgnify:CR=1 FL=1
MSIRLHRYIFERLLESDLSDSRFKLTCECYKMLSTFDCPCWLRCVYLQVGDPDLSFSLHRWNFMSLTSVRDQLFAYQSSNQFQAMDIAYTLLGLGHVLVASVDPTDGSVYYRHDGGSNGWDRALNGEFAAKCVPEHKRSYKDFFVEIKDSRAFNCSFWNSS